MTTSDTETTASGSAPGGGGRGRDARGGTGSLLANAFLRRREASIFLVTIAVAIYFSLTTQAFNTASNYHTIVQYMAPWAVISCGEVMLLICGEIDLSAGFMFTIAPFYMVLLHNNGLPLIVALIGALVLCGAAGLINGLIVTKLRMAAFITTLGMGFFMQGVMLLISNAEPVDSPSSGWVVQVFGHWSWSELIWVLVVVAIMQMVLSATRFGVYTLATGGNRIAASEAGISVDRVKIVNFTASAVLAGLIGIIDGTRVGSYDPTSGGWETMFFAVASAVIGGTALLGGSGTVVGALLGALVLSIVHDGFNLAGINANAFDVVLGVAVLAAMFLNVFLGRFRRSPSP